MGDPTVISAAFLLTQLAMIANKEVSQFMSESRTRNTITLNQLSTVKALDITSSDDEWFNNVEPQLISPIPRDTSLYSHRPLVPPPSFPCLSSRSLIHVLPTPALLPSRKLGPRRFSMQSTGKRSEGVVSGVKTPVNKSKWVGQTTPHQLKGVIRKKFSWKSFPELEDFLVQHRDEYFQHSAKFNYTTTQKEYNNALTTEVLDLANGLGYTFADFTFVELRDRIRCYYKSYNQAMKKQPK